MTAQYDSLRQEGINAYALYKYETAKQIFNNAFWLVDTPNINDLEEWILQYG